MLRKLSALLLTLCLLAAALTPWAAAAGGPRLVTSSRQAASQSVGFDRLPEGCQSLQATFTLSNHTACDFTADTALADLPGVYATYQQSGADITVYVTAKSGVLTQSGALTLGVLSANDGTPFTVAKATSLKVLGADSAETIYSTVDTSSTGGSTSGGSSGSTDSTLPFADIVQGAWYYAGVQYAYENGLMAGTGEGRFSPDLTTSRGMIVTILYRLAGSPAVSGGSAFSDVSQSDWYAAGVAWASANGIVSGYPDGAFRPDEAITREQMAAILFQYARFQGKLDGGRADLSAFADAASVSPWAQESLSWAVSQGLISGMSAHTLVPGGSTTRAQAAVILTAFSRSLG